MTGVAARAAARALAVALATGAPAAARDPDLLNVRLGPEYAGWLIGPIARIASEAEEREYSKLARDEDAAAFVDRFWDARDPDPAKPGNPAREAFERRAEEADRRFSEAGVSGRRSDRGTIWVVYGTPSRVEHEPSPIYGEPPLEIWRYDAGSPLGLDGAQPADVYRFVKRKDLTVHYVPGRPGRYTNNRPPGSGGAPR